MHTHLWQLADVETRLQDAVHQLRQQQNLVGELIVRSTAALSLCSWQMGCARIAGWKTSTTACSSASARIIHCRSHETAVPARRSRKLTVRVREHRVEV